MGDGIQVDPAALLLAAQGIDGAISELNEMGMLSEGETGRGFDSLTLTGMEAGHHGLAEAFGSFCNVWQWGVRALVQDANTLARELEISAGMYAHLEEYVEDSFSTAGKMVIANPHLSEEELAGLSLSDIGSSYTPDYSVESFGQGGEEIQETWSGVYDDVRETTEQKVNDPLGYYQDEFDRLRGQQPDGEDG